MQEWVGFTDALRCNDAHPSLQICASIQGWLICLQSRTCLSSCAASERRSWHTCASIKTITSTLTVAHDRFAANGAGGDAVPCAVWHHAGLPVHLLGVQLRASALDPPCPHLSPEACNQAYGHALLANHELQRIPIVLCSSLSSSSSVTILGVHTLSSVLAGRSVLGSFERIPSANVPTIKHERVAAPMYLSH